MFDLDGKRALVTGATGGLGGEIAKLLHAKGAHVALSGTRAEKLKSLASELGERSYTCLLYTSPSPRDGLLSRMPSSA